MNGHRNIGDHVDDVDPTDTVDLDMVDWADGRHALDGVGGFAESVGVILVRADDDEVG